MKKIFSFLVVVLLLVSKQITYGQCEAVAQLKNELPPQIEQIISEKDSASVHIQEVLFKLNDSGKVYCVIAYPLKKGKYPGMLVLHGGGGKAEKEKAIGWALQGYIAVAPDLPGIAEPANLIHTKGRWNSLKYGESRYITQPTIEQSVIFDAVKTAMKALYLLRSQRMVMKNKIGVIGISWGGYTTTMVAALAGEKVKAAFSLYGCGFYDKTSQTSYLNKMSSDDRETWLQCLDPGRKASLIQAHYFVAAATNDFFFYPKAVQATLNQITKHLPNQVFAPNANHKMPIPGGDYASVKDTARFVPTPFQPLPTPKGNLHHWVQMELPYMNFHLKGVGKPFPRITTLLSDKDSIARFSVKDAVDPMNAVIYWAKPNADPKKCEWKMLTTTLTKKGHYQAQLPEANVWWYPLISDSRNISVSGKICWGASFN